MIKNIISLVLLLTFIPTAQAETLVNLKDFKIEKISDNTIVVKYQSHNITIDKVDATRFKVNNEVVVLSPSETMSQLEQKLQRAYKNSSPKSAALEELFISKANAFPLLMAAVASGLFGLAMGDATCKTKNNIPYTQPQPAPAGNVDR